MVPGRPDLEGARNSLDALEFAVGLTRAGTASGLVTGPVSKAQLYAIGFVHPGQTEFVAERCGVASELVAMMLIGPDPEGRSPSPPMCRCARCRTCSASSGSSPRAGPRSRGLQRQFGIARPRLAVAGLNPHAGEDGTLGREEIEIDRAGDRAAARGRL